MCPFPGTQIKTFKHEDFCRIRNRRSFAQVDNLWSKQTRNDAREVNKWACETDNTHSVVYGIYKLQDSNGAVLRHHVKES